MTNLTCRATNCAYNKSEGCFATCINVNGKSAHTSLDTVCNSFVDKTFTQLTNETCDGSQVGTSQIECGAGHCRHNANKVCKADSVIITGRGATCQTFEQK